MKFCSTILQTTYEDFRLNEADVGDKMKWLTEGMDCNLLFWKGKVIWTLDITSYYLICEMEILVIIASQLVNVALFNQVIDFELPITVKLTVVDVDPGVRGDTAQGNGSYFFSWLICSFIEVINKLMIVEKA